MPDAQLARDPSGRSRYRIGLDIGGTFTDLILVDDTTGALRLHKCLTTPRDPSLGALTGLMELTADAGLDLAEIGDLVHGTTLVTNAIIERRGAKVGLLTTKGFRDIVEMGIEQRYDIYDLFLEFPEPLAPRALRREIDERITCDGGVLRPLDLDKVRIEIEALARAGVEAVAVSFLHSYRNPAHERAVAELAAREFPEIAVSLSAEVVPELREYERTTTTLANAFVQPLMDRYIAQIEAELRRRGFAGRFYLMQSAGGLASPEMARRFPIRLLESGPAGGGLATALFGRSAGKDHVISFDMGGTTAKACLVQDGRIDVAPMMEAARVHRFKRGSGLPIKAPVIDMIEIGAGGGSIAMIDEVGLLKVGPHSAGADPGPACYGKGGNEPTVTDANLVLGYLDPGFFPRRPHGARPRRRGAGPRPRRNAARSVDGRSGLGHLFDRLREHGCGGTGASGREGPRPAPLCHGRVRRRRPGARRSGRARPRGGGGHRPTGFGGGVGARFSGRARQLRIRPLGAVLDRRRDGFRTDQPAARRDRGARAPPAGGGRHHRRHHRHASGRDAPLGPDARDHGGSPRRRARPCRSRRHQAALCRSLYPALHPPLHRRGDRGVELAGPRLGSATALVGRPRTGRQQQGAGVQGSPPGLFRGRLSRYAGL